MIWRKSSRSAQGANCVEIVAYGGRRLVRDSKNPGGGKLALSVKAWSALVGRVKSGDFDR